ncbi:methylcrotonoyl-CoA carboxylase, partial [candidate division KSB1 bacterium]|nr:methylcrotonoyl-CoA carboxylase [candidate division KSB1 bacterium]
MKRYESQINKKSEEYKRRHSAMLNKLSELNLQLKKVKEENPKAVEKLKKRGKYPAREKIRRIIDPGTEMLEIGALAAHEMYNDIPGVYPSAGSIIPF